MPLTKLLLSPIFFFSLLSHFPIGNCFGNGNNDTAFSVSKSEEVLNFTLNENKIIGGKGLDDRFSLVLQVNPEGAGSVLGAGSYSEGEIVNVSATAGNGYSFESWSRDYEVISVSPSFDFPMPAEDVILVANFSLNTYTISANSNPEDGGTITGTDDYVHGAEVTLDALPNPCYTFENWTENGQVVSEDETYQFEAASNRELVANFSFQIFTVTASPGQGGTINPSGSIEVGCGGQIVFSITPDDCYEISELLVNGQNVEPSNTYPLNVVNENHNIEVFFQKPVFSITSSASHGGFIIPSGEVIVECGEQQSFEITPDDGYAILDVKIDGEGIGPTNNYEFIDVRDHQSIEALFIPFINGPAQVCLGEWSSYELNTDLFSEYSNLKWSIQNGGGQILGPDNLDRVMVQWGNVSGLQHLNLDVFTDSHPNPSNYVIEVEVAGTPPPEAIIVRKGENILLVDQVSGPSYDEYQWGIMNAVSFSDTLLEEEDNQFCWFEDINTSSVFYWVETRQSGNACKIRSFFNHPTGQQDHFSGGDLIDILLFPLPASQNFVYVKWPAFPFNQLEINLMSLEGKVSESFQFNFSEVNLPLKLNLAEVPTGFYLVRFSFDKRQITKPLLIH
jgi:hypothetical protein